MWVMPHGDTEHSDRAYSGKWNISVPEGKETNISIPQVAASENGEAQTAGSNTWRGSKTET